MPDLTFNTPQGETIVRELLIAYLNTGDSMSPTWSPVGKCVVESSLKFDWAEESKRDIFGNTYTTLKKPVITQTFEPYELDSGDAAHVAVWNRAIRDQDPAAVANNDMLIVHAYVGTKDTAVFAERYESCKVAPTSLGGSTTVDMSLEVTYGGKRTTGTAKLSGGSVTFSPEV